MKKLSMLFLAIFITAGTAFGFAGGSSPADKPTSHQVEQRLRVLNSRIEEIKSMEVNSLSLKDRRALKMELKSIKKEMRALDGGIYISAGALLVILILILLL